MQTVCEKNMCTGCMACFDKCTHGALELKRSLSSYNVVIHKEKCTECDACKKVCQNNSELEMREPIEWLEGWASNPSIRSASSSGGFASAMMKSFIESGGVVCSCVFEKGNFIFRITRSEDELSAFRGSKYVKSNPEGIYKEIEKLIKEKKVLFIGLPCQVAALKNFVPERYWERLYTVDLICHGTPSPFLLEKFIMEHGYEVNNLNDIRFRRKEDFRLTDELWKPISENGIADRYTYSFLHAFNYTENCYSCRYARRQRVSDITIGDSWGTERKDEKKRGISLALVQTEKGKKLIDNSNLVLFQTDAAKAIAANHQLKTPSVKDKRWSRLFKALDKGRSYDCAVFYATPYGVLKQNVKKILLKAQKNSGGGYRIEVKIKAFD